MAKPASPSLSGSAALVGRVEPRLFTPPLRKLTRRTSRGYEVADFAEKVLGEPALPWQRWLWVHALETNPDQTYRFRVVLVLVARQNGKTRSVSVVSLWRMYIDGARLILSSAQDLSFGREVWADAISVIQSVPDLAAELHEPRRVNGDEQFSLTNGARWKISAANEKAGRGLSVDLVALDELRTQTKWDAWSSLSKTTQARRSGQVWCASNAGDDRSIVLNGLREAALSGRDDSIGLFEWSGADGCDLDDRKAWRQANPGLGHLITERALTSSLATDPPEVFRSEVLCQRVTALDTAIDMPAWTDCRDRVATLASLRARVAVVVDVSVDSAHVSAVAAALAGDGRVRVEPVGAWSGTGKAREELPGLLKKITPATVGWFPSGPGAALAPLFTDRATIRGTDVTAACMGFADLVASRSLTHPGDPLLDAHVAGVAKLWTGDGWRFVRRGAGHADAAYAAAGAAYLALTLPAEKPRLRPIAMSV
jgi:hypothetical protein